MGSINRGVAAACNARRRSVLAVLAAVVSLGIAQGAWGQIEVVGRGEATAPPAVATLAVSVAGSGPLAEDANVKFGDAKKQAIDALKAAEVPGLTIVEKGTDISVQGSQQQMMQMMQGMIDESTPIQMDVNMSETLECSISDLDKLEPADVADRIIKLIDTARNANLQLGASAGNPMLAYQMRMYGNDEAAPMVLFKPRDGEALRKAAYRKAIDDARTRATELADMAGVTLGKIQAVQVLTDDSNMMWTPWGPRQAGDDSEVVSGTLTDITMSVAIHVKFAVE